MTGLARKFGGSVLDELNARATPRATSAQQIPINAIEEDPNQPRRHFDQAALESLAASIRRKGVLQAVGVRELSPGRYRLTFGARRLRASRMADRETIPAVLADKEQQDVEAQVIENQQRVGNTNSELAAAVIRMTEEGLTNQDIATALALSDPQGIKHYRVLTDLPEEIAPWIDRAPARALYELAQAWRKGEPAQAIIRDALPPADEDRELTITEARRMIALATGKSAGTFDRPSALPTQDGPMAPSDPVVAPDAPEYAAAPPRARSAVADVDADRVARVKAWLADPTRPRPPLSV